MTLVAALAGQSPLTLMSAMLLIAWSVAFVMIRKTKLPFRAGIRIGLCVVAVAVAVATFAYTVNALLTHPQFSTDDIAIAHALGSAIAPDVKRVFAQITHLGDPWLLAIWCVLTTYRATRAQTPRSARLRGRCSVGRHALLNITLKHLIRRTRPVWDTTLATAQGWSFPSGHTSGSIATYGVIAYVLVRTLPARWHLTGMSKA